jgi:curved DNA-binding protein CbpA
MNYLLIISYVLLKYYTINREINQAYDVLSNDELRKTYDEFQENPEKSEMYHYYNWYRARYMPQVDPRLVISLILLAFSIIQYTVRKTMYETALKYIENTSKFKTTLNTKWEESKTKGEKKVIRRDFGL